MMVGRWIDLCRAKNIPGAKEQLARDANEFVFEKPLEIRLARFWAVECGNSYWEYRPEIPIRFGKKKRRLRLWFKQEGALRGEK